MSHFVTLTWNADPDVPQPYVAGSGYNIYKGVAPGAEGATPINASPVQALTYIDSAVAAGVTYDYYITAVANGKESAASQQANSTVPLQPPTGLVAVAA